MDDGDEYDLGGEGEEEEAMKMRMILNVTILQSLQKTTERKS